MIIRWSPGILPSTGRYIGNVFANLVGGTANGTNGGGGTTPAGAQSISPSSLTIATSGTATFTTNYPAIWTSSTGSVVAAGDGLSAVFTAGSSPASGTVTATNEDDPGNAASAPVTISGIGPVAQGDIIGQHGTQASRSLVGI